MLLLLSRCLSPYKGRLPSKIGSMTRPASSSVVLKFVLLPIYHSAHLPHRKMPATDTPARNPSALQLLSPSRILRSRLQQVKRDKHRRVWENIFSDQSWTERAINAKLNPVLIGPSLDIYYSYRPKSKAIYLYLSVGDVTGDFTVRSVKNTELFFDCLKPHVYEYASQEVKFDDCGITLNISDLVADRIGLVPNRVLTQRFHRLQSMYLFWNDDTHVLRKLRAVDILGLPTGPLQCLSDVSSTCELILTCPNGF